MQTHKIESEETIRSLAHDFWEAEGRPEGRAELHWQRALETLNAPLAGEATAPKPKKKPTKAAKKN